MKSVFSSIMCWSAEIKNCKHYWHYIFFEACKFQSHLSFTSSCKTIELNKTQHSSNRSSSGAHNLLYHFQASPPSPQPNCFISATIVILLSQSHPPTSRGFTLESTSRGFTLESSFYLTNLFGFPLPALLLIGIVFQSVVSWSTESEQKYQKDKWTKPLKSLRLIKDPIKIMLILRLLTHALYYHQSTFLHPQPYSPTLFLILIKLFHHTKPSPPSSRILLQGRLLV